MTEGMIAVVIGMRTLPHVGVEVGAAEAEAEGRDEAEADAPAAPAAQVA